MIYRLAADGILILHLFFVLFVLLGGLLVLLRPSFLWVHLAAVIWGVLVEWADWLCPLTPLENLFRKMGGKSGYPGGFIEHYLTPLLYPEELTIELRYLLGLIVIVVNLTIYGYILLRHRQKSRR